MKESLHSACLYVCSYYFAHRLTARQDVLQLVEALYAEAVANVFKKQDGARPDHSDFYGYIHHVRVQLETAQWEVFFKKMLLRITVSCKRLQQRNVPRLHNTSPTRPHCELGTSSSSESQKTESTPSPASSSRSSYHGRSPSPLDMPKSSPCARNAPHKGLGPNTHRAAKDMSRYTVVLQWHVDVEGGFLDYQYESLSLNPPEFRCIVDYDGYSANGTGRSKQEAKHAASKQMCSLLNIDLY
jgi:hypothetical protein